MARYNPSEIELKWQRVWAEKQTYAAKDFSDKPKFVMLTEFPYPSGDKLHMGHMRLYTLGDIIARRKRANGMNVLFPMGFDAFGLPAENYAIKNKTTPQAAVQQNIANARAQLESMGYSIDWNRSFSTTDPEYYRWTQWLFLQFYKAGLAYQDEIAINWCPFCKTGLANEEVVNGRHERCENLVEKKMLKQWMLRITDYAERLIDGLESVDYPSRIADQQINWIGKSVGAEIEFEIAQCESTDKKLPENLIIRKPTVDDCEKVRKMHAKSWRETYPNQENKISQQWVNERTEGWFLPEKMQESREKFAEIEKTNDKTQFYRVAEIDGEIAGFIHGFYDEKNRAELAIYLDKTQHGNGLASELMREMLDWFGDQEIKLRVATYNLRAINFYKKFGFEIVENSEKIACDKLPTVKMVLKSDANKITVFTTRPDTIFGATFMVLAPEHPLVAKITTDSQRAKVDSYIKTAQSKSEIERQDAAREKTGVFTGSYAINPASKEKIPIYVADYVLMGYGTGAIMAVPAHDERDYEFAKKFNLEVREVIAPDFGETRNHEEEKDGITAIIYSEKTDEFAVLDWADQKNYYTVVAGGCENDESYETTLHRELCEEAGISKVVKIIQLGEPVFAHYYHNIKKINRRGKTQGFLVIVDDKQGEDVKREMHEKFEIKWISQNKFAKLNFAGDNHDTGHWDLLRERALKYLMVGEVRSETFSAEGIMINSEQFDGLSSGEASEKIVDWLSKKGVASRKTQYKLRDWVYSRQHYWGEPIPIIHCEKCGAVPVPDDQLPVELPQVDHYEPTDDGESPLSLIDDWVNTTCPKCGEPAKRETDTMPNWAGSNWYYLRYYDAHNNQVFADPKKLEYWGEADLYLGGMEHTTLHLLYSRFHHQFLYDQGLVPTPEPYAARRGQGIILATDGTKMSKSKGNVVNPTEIIESGYGADALRLAITFLAPYDQTTPWNPESVAGCYRFLTRVWDLAQAIHENAGESSPETLRAIHGAIKKVTEDTDKMNFNTAIAAMMEALNSLNKIGADKIASTDFVKFIQVLAPFAPHLAAELTMQLGGGELDDVGWPGYDEKCLETDEMTIAVQVNGKLRGEIQIAKTASEDEIKAAALALENVQNFTKNKKPARTIYVPEKIVNIVVAR